MYTLQFKCDNGANSVMLDADRYETNRHAAPHIIVPVCIPFLECY